MTYQEMFVLMYREHIKRPGADALLNWLENETYFFDAPASTKYHGAYQGGLVEHSVNVYNRLYRIAGSEVCGPHVYSSLLLDVRESIAVMALLHDVCKHDIYHKQEDGSYTRFDPFPIGHGEKSIYLISQYMKLTPEEALAIRWHMGAYDDAARGNLQALNAAMKLTPWVWYLHEADMGASQIDEREVEAEE